MATIYIGNKKEYKKIRISRGVDRSGIIRVDAESCDILEDLLSELSTDISIKQLASILIKTAAEQNIFKEGN